MSGRTRFPKLHALLTGAAPGATSSRAQDDDRDDRRADDDAPEIDAAAIESAAAQDLSAAVSAERTRWATVLDSEEGQANAGLARHLLSTSDMGATEIGAALKAAGPGAGKSNGGEADDDLPAREPGESAQAYRNRLASADTNVQTGRGGGGQANGGRDADTGRKTARERLAASQERQNKALLAKGGKLANAPA